MKEYIAMILELTGQAEAFRPAIEQAVKAVKGYGPEVYSLAEGVCQGSVDLKAMMIKRYQEEHGFSREEAIILVMDQWQSMLQRLDKSNKSAKK